ncbi:hypothetical protein Q7C36_016056 [Tachysurus vachellii]|uniref:DDE Tnp4 domain-containing protein n=1 Tax=Tachysurus vachellii TaxID=175792 RepID=A0AA88SG66_TACVA|nr:hypothetical protein Q7C36_016056 [Tachysurus vachellii]
MKCPFMDDPVNEEAVLILRELHLHRERILRPTVDVLSHQYAFLFERYRFSLHRDGCALTSEQMLCIALRFFTNGSFLYNIRDAEHISKATVCRAVRKVCLTLKRFLTIFVLFPGHKPVRVIKEKFYRIAGFPNAVGCIDGTHIPIIAPSENEAAKWPGSVHDSRMYQESTLSNRVERGEIDGFLLGDMGYPCRPNLITSYTEPEPGPQQHFNVAHCRTRSRVEMTIGLLKARFQCLHHLRVTPERACDIILARVVHHNIAIIRGEQQPALQLQDPEEDPINPADFQDGRVVRYDMLQCLLRLIMISTITTKQKKKKENE